MNAEGVSRRAELERRLRDVTGRISAAALAAGRDPEEITLVAVTKHFPASDLALLVDAGHRDIGENRDQEASVKVAELDTSVRQALTVHFIGQLQTNKARSVVRYADLVHSVDRGRLVRALDRAVEAARGQGERTTALDVLVQVDLAEGAQAGRGGVLPTDLDGLAATVEKASHLSLRGIMAVAPPGLDRAGITRAFDRLMTLSRSLQERYPHAAAVSAGMSQDLEAAVACGATHLRVGTAILGSRAPHG